MPTETEQKYEDPKDLRDIPLERLKWEAQRLAHQFNEWNNFFSVESAMRISTGKSGQPGYGDFSEIHRWSIVSNRWLLMDREHLSDYKLFNKEEVLKLIQSAYNSGWQDGEHSKEENLKQYEGDQKYMEQMAKI
jgi:hypothetical protein